MSGEYVGSLIHSCRIPTHISARSRMDKPVGVSVGGGVG